MIIYIWLLLLCNCLQSKACVPHGSSPVNMPHIFRIPFPDNTSGGLLLIFRQNFFFWRSIFSWERWKIWHKKEVHTFFLRVLISLRIWWDPRFNKYTNFSSMFPYCIFWKYRKTKGFLIFSWLKKGSIGLKQVKNIDTRGKKYEWNPTIEGLGMSARLSLWFSKI